MDIRKEEGCTCHRNTWYVNRMVTCPKSVWRNYSSALVKRIQGRWETISPVCGQMKEHRVRCPFWVALHLKVEWSSHSLQMLLLLGNWINSEIVHYTILFILLVSPQINRAYFLRLRKFLILISLTGKKSLETLLKESWKVISTFLKKYIFI